MRSRCRQACRTRRRGACDDHGCGEPLRSGKLQDIGDITAAQRWTDRALLWACMTDEPDLTAYVLARKSQLAADTDDGGEAVSWCPRRSRAWARPILERAQLIWSPSTLNLVTASPK